MKAAKHDAVQTGNVKCGSSHNFHYRPTETVHPAGQCTGTVVGDGRWAGVEALGQPGGFAHTVTAFVQEAGSPVAIN